MYSKIVYFFDKRLFAFYDQNINLMAMNRRKSTEERSQYEGKKIQINIIFEKQGEGIEQNYPISFKTEVCESPSKEINLSEIILKLKEHCFNDYFNSSVSYYHEGENMYTFGFILPLDVSEKELLEDEKFQKKIHESIYRVGEGECCIKLRFRKKNKSKLEFLKQEQREKYGEIEPHQENRNSKQKQKTIAEVIQKVALWRKLYTGFLNEKGETVHMDLESSATEIGIVKKTLDDYLLQIRNGKRYGFNFHKRRHQKIGELRSFVREKKLEDDKTKKIKK